MMCVFVKSIRTADVGIKLVSLSTKEVVVNTEKTTEDTGQKDQR